MSSPSFNMLGFSDFSQKKTKNKNNKKPNTHTKKNPAKTKQQKKTQPK